MSASTNRRRVLVLDPDPDIRNQLLATFRLERLAPSPVETSQELLRMALADPHELIVIDAVCTAPNGDHNLAAAIRKSGGTTPILRLSGNGIQEVNLFSDMFLKDARTLATPIERDKLYGIVHQLLRGEAS